MRSNNSPFSKMKESATRNFGSMSSSSHSTGYLMNQVNCILSLDRNRQTDYRNVPELFATYNTILSNESSPDFKNSLVKSKLSFEEQCFGNNVIHKEEIQALKMNKPDSFLIVPLVSENHLFCCVVRQNDLGYSATLVNASKGGRRGDDRGNHVGYEEYIFEDKKLAKLCDVLKAVKHGNGYSSRYSNSQIYDLFEKEADKRFNLSIVSRDQKDGNCYVKEPEKAIKFAFATSNFSDEQFNLLRNQNGPVFTPKWPSSSEIIHKKYIEILKFENPTLSNKLDEKLDKYLTYKNFIKNESDKKFLVNGRSLLENSKITFQDNLAQVKATAKNHKQERWLYSDANNNPIGYSLIKENTNIFYDSDDKLVGFSKKESVGEKYYDKDENLIGYSRFFYGMKDYNGEICAEQKGSHPVDILLALTKEKELNKNIIIHTAGYTHNAYSTKKDPNINLMQRYLNQKLRPKKRDISNTMTL